MTVHVSTLACRDIPVAASLLAAGMESNPLHQRVFGGAHHKLPSLLVPAFTDLLTRQRQHGYLLGAYQKNQLAGMVGMALPGQCQPSLPQAWRMLKLLWHAGLLHRLPAISWWLSQWHREDPNVAHWHLGPAAVWPSQQGLGIGSQLLNAACEHLDAAHAIGYLETDKADNVRLYRRGGFAIHRKRQILGVTNWFMLRHPKY